MQASDADDSDGCLPLLAIVAGVLVLGILTYLVVMWLAFGQPVEGPGG